MATIVSGIMLEKQIEKAANTDHVVIPNYRMFDSEQEALKWLLE